MGEDRDYPSTTVGWPPDDLKWDTSSQYRAVAGQLHHVSRTTYVTPNDVDGGTSVSSDDNLLELARISTFWFWSVSGDQHIASGMGE